ncbi:MAG: prolipoprotein diacylglyceryl transferase [Bacteroidota bacterium]|nr:prolipoprotein diacylglyceryl transferase [Bacteroidota bacterium]
MEKHFLMDISNGGVLYQAFYLLAFLSAYTILIYEGYKRKFPLLSWVLLLTSVQLAAIIGTKVFSYSWNDWQYMFRNHTLLLNREKSLLGCVLLAAGTFLAAKKIMKFRYPVWDTFAIAFPVAVSFMTTGCFLYGCCHGTITHLPWAVQYPVMSLAHYHQFEAGLLTNNDLYSLPVHPVQLYATAGGIIVALLVMRLRRHLKATGSLLICSVMLFVLMRFTVEFFRDPQTNRFGGDMLWILKQVQWLYLLTATVMGILLFIREKSFKTGPDIGEIVLPGLTLQVLFLLSLVIIFALLRNWFRLPEIMALNIALVPALIFTGIEIYKRSSSYRYRWVFVCSLILPIFLMSQTLPQTKIDSSLIKNYKTYHTIGGGFATGSYTDERTNFTGSGCDMVSNTEYFTQKYTAGGGNYIYTLENPEKETITRFGAGVALGNYRQTRFSTGIMSKFFLFDFHPYVKYDTRWIGIGGGLHMGNIPFTRGDTNQEGTGTTTESNFNTYLFPQFYLRVGIARYLFADFHVADQLPVSSPGLGFQAGVGSGLGLKSGLNIRTGFSFLERNSYYISAYLPIENSIVIEPLFNWTFHQSIPDGYPNLPENQFSLGISYRFGHK